MMSVDPSSAPPFPAATLHIAWVPPPGGFLGLSLLNGALRVITLGIYHFWGKTEVRQRIWSAIRINGEPLEYRGTGSELFRGFLIVFGLVLVPLAVSSFFMPLILGARSAGRGFYELSVWSLLLLLWGLGIHRARRYRLSRTRWRGIRAGLSGASWAFAWTYLWTTALVPLTLGWILPWRAAHLQSRLFNDTHFGDKAFVFTGRSGPLYKRFWLVWLSAIVLFAAASGLIAMQAMPNGVRSAPQSMTGVKAVQILAILFTAFLIFAMIRAWYGASMLNYFASQTTYQGATFKLNARVGSLVWLTATNYLLTILTLGFLSPIAQARAMRYIVDRLAIDGAVPLQQVSQNLDVLLRRGEGLAEAFNVDAF
jgi:uncharacterized membrane protein YjgN (DUF898 family)